MYVVANVVTSYDITMANKDLVLPVQITGHHPLNHE